MEFFVKTAGERDDEIERNAFILGVEVTDDRRAAAERVMEDFRTGAAATASGVQVELPLAEQLVGRPPLGQRVAVTPLQVQHPGQQPVGVYLRNPLV